jgi:hypothetical protein
VGASVTLSAPSVAVDPGAEASLEFRLRNSGAVVDEFTLDVLGDAAGWATVVPPTVSLFPGAEETARIVFRPPRVSTTPAGPMPFGLRAASREDPAGSSVEEGTVEVGWFLEPFVELVPRTSRGARGATHELAVDNRGNVRLNAEVDATDADRLLAFDVNPPAVVVEPGMAGFSKVRVKPVRRFWRGAPKTRPFQLSVQPEGYLPITIDGTLLQEAMLPPWFGRAVAALIGLLLALVLLWFLVLRPTIDSAVSGALESPIADLRGDVNDALGAAGLPTLNPDGGGPPPTPTPTPAPGETPAPPTPTPTPAGPVIPGLGNPVDGRLDEGSPSVPAAGTLFITDLVFSNPNGQEGALVLLRDSTPLYQLRLENFRDFDLHFVTPIVLVPGQSLNLSLACTAEGPCDPSVLYSGYLRP